MGFISILDWRPYKIGGLRGIYMGINPIGQRPNYIISGRLLNFVSASSGFGFAAS